MRLVASCANLFLLLKYLAFPLKLFTFVDKLRRLYGNNESMMWVLCSSCRFNADALLSFIRVSKLSI